MAAPFPTRILVPIDVSEFHQQSFDLAVALAASSGAEVVVLSVADDSFPYPDMLSFQEPHDDYYRLFRDRALGLLDKVAAGAPSGVRIRPLVSRGRPARVIVDVAREESVDLVVMTTHSTHGLEHAILGSVTDKVLRLASCPVLVIPLRGHDDH